jgi:hypothetical protein
MARQAGSFFIRGCFNNICFYPLAGNHYARAKSSLTKRRVKNDPAFRETMQYARLLGEASGLASGIYLKLRKEERNLLIFRKLTGMVMKLLKEERSTEEIRNVLEKINQ